MTDHEAKEILKLYRPGSADSSDPAFADALALCERDPELKKWFDDHCALYLALRAKFKAIVVPEGLKEQIIAEHPIRRAPVWQRAVILGGAVAAAFMIVSSYHQWHRPSDPGDFAAYRNYMVGFASRGGGYAMDERSNDPKKVRSYFAGKNVIADYVIPANLQKNAQLEGCASFTWHGKNVSMICYSSGRPLDPGQASDLWLFVTDRTTTQDTPTAPSPKFDKVDGKDGLIAASWTADNRTYVLATRGDEQFLGKYLGD